VVSQVRVLEAWLRAHKALGRPEAEAAAYRTRRNNAKSGFNYVFYQAPKSLQKSMQQPKAKLMPQEKWVSAGGGSLAALPSYGDPKAAADPEQYGAEPLQTVLSLALRIGVADLPHVNNSVGVAAALLRDVQVLRLCKLVYPAHTQHIPSNPKSPSQFLSSPPLMLIRWPWELVLRAA
jgi:hypothetical protein